MGFGRDFGFGFVWEGGYGGFWVEKGYDLILVFIGSIGGLFIELGGKLEYRWYRCRVWKMGGGNVWKVLFDGFCFLVK